MRVGRGVDVCGRHVVVVERQNILMSAREQNDRGVSPVVSTVVASATARSIISDRRSRAIVGRLSLVGIMLWLITAALSVPRLAGVELVGETDQLTLDGSGPYQLRAVLFSPTFWGFDDDLYYQTPYYGTHWPTLFERDLDVLSALGANAIRLHGYFGVTNNGGRHEAFLDACVSRNMSVLLSY